MSSKIDHPDHYNQINGIECIDVVEEFDFNCGNAIKYIWRSGKKGNEVEDLEKAKWYINREIERIQENEMFEELNPGAVITISVLSFVVIYGLISKLMRYNKRR